MPNPQKKYWGQIPKNKKLGWSAQAESIFADPKAKTDLTSYLIDVVWDGRICYTYINIIDDC